MGTTDLVHEWSAELPQRKAATHRNLSLTYGQLVGPARRAILHARQQLLSTQHNSGAWRGRQYGDASLPSQLILVLSYFGDPQCDRSLAAAEAIIDQQGRDGGWSLLPDGPMDLSVSVQAYFALKLAGQDPQLQCLRRARQAIRERGGADAADTTTRRWLALFGDVCYDCCPPVDPLPIMSHMRRNRYWGSELSRSNAPLRLAAWTVIDSRRHTCPLPGLRSVRELFVQRPDSWPRDRRQGPDSDGERRSRFRSLQDKIPSQQLRWIGARFGRSQVIDSAIELLEEVALDACELELRFDDLIWQLIALDASGFSEGSDAVIGCRKRLRQLIATEDEMSIVLPQPATSTRFDTLLAVAALQASGMTPTSAVGAREQASESCDNVVELATILSAITALANPAADPALPPSLGLADGLIPRPADPSPTSEWADTSIHPLADCVAQQLLRRQNSDGGWPIRRSIQSDMRTCGVLRSASCREQDAASTPDATGAVLAALAQIGQSPHDVAMRRGVEFLRAAQRADGSWDSATGVRWIHGTSWAIRGMMAAGIAPNDLAAAAGVNWLIVHQHESGGWGETVDPTAGRDDFLRAPAAAIQTAWALLALVAAGHADHDATRRGVQFLLDTQEDDGRWSDMQFTLRTPNAERWFRNQLHSLATPLHAMADWVVAAARGHAETSPPRLRLFGAAATD